MNVELLSLNVLQYFLFISIDTVRTFFSLSKKIYTFSFPNISLDFPLGNILSFLAQFSFDLTTAAAVKIVLGKFNKNHLGTVLLKNTENSH